MAADFEGCNILAATFQNSEKKKFLKYFTASAILIYHLLNYFKPILKMADIFSSCNYPAYSETLPAVYA